MLFAIGLTLAVIYFRREARIRELAQNEHQAAGALKILAAAEADFRGNDRDGNPAEWGVTGRRMFILNENNTIFECREPGPPPKAWPTDAQLKQSWSVYPRLGDPR